MTSPASSQSTSDPDSKGRSCSVPPMATPCAVGSLEIDQWGPFALFKCEVGHSYACCSAACSKDFERLCCEVKARESAAAERPDICMEKEKDT